jgi:hypothetical protein
MDIRIGMDKWTWVVEKGPNNECRVGHHNKPLKLPPQGHSQKWCETHLKLTIAKS